MTGTLKTTLIQNPSSADVNITLGTSGEVTLAKSPVLNGSTSGTLTIAAPAVAGTNTQTLVAATGTLAPLISATAQASTSGTSIDFTGIPSWVKRITVMFSGVSTNGSSDVIVQVGDSGGIENTGYLGAGSNLAASTVATSNYTTGFGFGAWTASASIAHGAMVWNLLDAATNTWAGFGSVARSNAAGMATGSSAKSLTGTLTQIRITTLNGTDTFDAGTINIMYE